MHINEVAKLSRGMIYISPTAPVLEYASGLPQLSCHISAATRSGDKSRIWA